MTRFIDEEPHVAEPLIQLVQVDELFGARSYALEQPFEEGGRLFLLHGENGSGKTTMLRLLWNLLSPAEDQGHRTALVRVPFRRFQVHMAGGYGIVVEKGSELVGDYTIRYIDPSQSDQIIKFWVDQEMKAHTYSEEGIVWHFSEQPALFDDNFRESPRVDARRESVQAARDQARQNARAEEVFYSFLRREQIAPILLADDRRVYSDDDEISRLRTRQVALASRRGRDATPDFPEQNGIFNLELRVTMQRVNDWLTTLALRGQNTGFAQANSVYRDVLLQIARPYEVDDGDASSLGEVVRAIGRLAEIAPKFERYELTPRFDADEFLRLVHAVEDPNRRALAGQVLRPYLNSLESRYQALEHAEAVLSSLIPLVNEFFTDKELRYEARKGLVISAQNGDALDPSALSSGERQLMMLLCTVLMAGRDSRLCLIDEPELSLGVRWQRQIIDAFMQLTRGSNLQFFIATHSVEVMTGRPDCLVRLANL